MRNGVHSRCGCQARRKAQRKFGIADGPLRDQVRRDEPEFTAILQGYQSCPTDLAARAGRGWNCNQRGNRRSDPWNTAQDRSVLLQWPTMRRQKSDALRQINRRAPSDRNQPVAALRSVEVQRRKYRALRRVRGRFGKHRHVLPPGQDGFETIDQPSALNALISNDQRRLDA